MELDENVLKDIIRILPKDKTDAIYIFGSYGTEFFDEESDIDIGWFCENVDSSELVNLTEELEQKVGRKVDLIIPDYNRPMLLHNILCGRPIGGMSDKFSDWFDENIIELRDFCEILDEFIN